MAAVSSDAGNASTTQAPSVAPTKQAEENPAAGGLHVPAASAVDEDDDRVSGDTTPRNAAPASMGTGTEEKDAQSLATEVQHSKSAEPSTTSPAVASTTTAAGSGTATSTTATGTTAGKPKSTTTSKSKPSFFSKLVHKLVPCVGSSSRGHPVELDDTTVSEKDTKQPAATATPPAAAAQPETKPSAETAPTPAADGPSTTLPKITTSESSTTAAAAATAIPSPEVILPQTPTSKLLPEAETHGLLSGAVQPPGSTGDVITQAQDTSHQSEEESEGGTSYTEDEEAEVNHILEDAQDEEERLIMNGGAGIPIGPDGQPRPLLPPLAPHMAGRKCLVLDLDETLVHSSFKSIQQADYVVPVEIEYNWHNVYVIKRPGVDNFLQKMGQIYEVVVFTASLSKYADPVLDKLDIHQVVQHRLFRESCYNHKGNYVKDLSQLGRPIEDLIILDNSPASYIFHPNNAVPVSSWFNDPHDTELTDLCPFLADMTVVPDVRGILDGGI